MKLKLGLLAGVALLLAGLNTADAQNVQPPVVPIVPSLNQNDVVQVLPHGAPAIGNQYAPSGAIGGQELYSYQVPLTGFSIAVPNFTSLLYLQPAGTLATGTVTMMPNPSDGQRFCFQSTQINTAITFTLASGQNWGGTISPNPPTAYGTANTRLCWFWNAAQSTWFRIQ
jgi:hypothetical protein